MCYRVGFACANVVNVLAAGAWFLWLQYIDPSVDMSLSSVGYAVLSGALLGIVGTYIVAAAFAYIIHRTFNSWLYETDQSSLCSGVQLAEEGAARSAAAKACAIAVVMYTVLALCTP